MVIRDLKFKKKKPSLGMSIHSNTKQIIIDRLKNLTADEIRKRVLNIHFIKSG